MRIADSDGQQTAVGQRLGGGSPRPPERGGGVLGPVRRHPLLSFFVLANLMSWLAWLPYILSENGLGPGASASRAAPA